MLPTPKKICHNQYVSVLAAIFLTAGLGAAVYLYTPRWGLRGILWFGCLIIAGYTYRWLTAKWRRRVKLANENFPSPWRQTLKERVAFYTRLDNNEKQRFEKMVHIFIAEKPIVAAGCEVDDECRVLVAASAVIPVFAFDDWEYDMLDEIIIRPHAFSAVPHLTGTPEEVSALGAVHTAGMAGGLMVLSKPDLYRGFEIHGDRHNVGIHEFAHLLDKATGHVDGVLAGLPASSFRPWLMLMGSELRDEVAAKSDIPQYGFTSEVEFFAVVSEYFFEDPDHLKEAHPELYEMMTRIYRQQTRQRFAGLKKRLFQPIRRRTSRNAPCPCGSGEKYKHCCGR